MYNANVEGDTRKMDNQPYRQPEEQEQPPRTQGPSWRLIIVAITIFIFGIAVGFGLDENVFQDRFQDVAHTDLPRELDYDSVDEVYLSLREKYDGELTLDEIMDGLKQGLARATGDPYTEYLNAEASQEFQDDLDGTFSGIGAELGRDEDAIIVVAPLSGYPAEDAGLRPLDIIVEIDGESAAGISINEAVNRIRGPVDTEVDLTVVRNFERLEFTITRETITVPSVEYEIQDGGIGYIKVSRFGSDSVGIVTRALDEFDAENVDSIILDLRNNPGGLLNTSIELSDLWLPQGAAILEERRGDQVVRSFEARSGVSVNASETVVLINQGSASASEIVAGALRDNDAATIVGMTSFGKGSVQQLDELRSGGTLKVTIARWYTPNGLNIDKEGIEPDEIVERTDEDFREDRDPQLEAAQRILRE